MTNKRANLLFLTMILTHIGVVMILSFLGDRMNVGITAKFFLGEAILMVPALLFLLFTRRRKTVGHDTGMFHRIKISTLLMIMLSTLLLMPFVTVLNTLTLFFTDNAVAAIEGAILNVPFPVMLIMIGIFGPFCEEFVFRGVIYGSYTRGLAAVFLSAFTFGLMHMNFNQALYAFAIGIFLAVLAEAAGSLWAAVFCHMFFNSYEVVMMYLSKAILGSAYVEAVNEAAGELTGVQIQAALAVYLLIAAVTTPIAVCCVAWIAKNEGRQETVRALFHAAGGNEAQKNTPGETQREQLITGPLIVAVVLCLGFMSLEWFLL